MLVVRIGSSSSSEQLQELQRQSRLLESVVCQMRRRLHSTNRQQVPEEERKEVTQSLLSASRALDLTSELQEEAQELRASLESACARACADDHGALAEAVVAGAGDMERQVRRVRAEIGLRGQGGDEDVLAVFGLWLQAQESVKAFGRLDREAAMLKEVISKVSLKGSSYIAQSKCVACTMG